MSLSYILSNNSLIAVDTANPDSPGTAVPVTGIGAGENLVGIDFRPQNGRLYGLTSNGTGVRLYVISPQTGTAVALTNAPVQFDDGSGNAIPITGTNFGIDFNPTVDRLRVVTDSGLNFRMNPNTGTLVDSNAGTPGVNPDGNINRGGTAATVDATAYTNNAPNAAVTTQYTLDAVTNQLLIQAPPNTGAQTNALNVTLNGSVLDFTAVSGFDIPAGINVTTANAPATGQAFATLTVNGTAGLYCIELSTGAATLLGPVGAGTQPAQGLAVRTEAVANGVPLVGVDAAGTNLLRFNSATPGTVSSVALSGVPAGEAIVGIDFRPATGQLFALSVNAATDTGSLLILDPQTGAATVVGTAGQIALVDGSGNPIDLPTSGFGIDFNPTVDRLRVVTSNGLNFRVNPLTGAAVDANATTPGVNPDGGINLGGAAATVDATAYTNSFAGATVTTQYTLDAASDRLFIQNPPNNGTQTNGLAVTLNGSALDFTAVNGFDIPSSVRVATSNTPATGRGIAALTVGGSTNLYTIDLSTGAATLLGPVGTGATGLAGLTAAEPPVGTIAFQQANYSVAESGGSVALTLVRSGGAFGTATVNVAATGGTATANSDFTGAPTTVTFADGQTTATVNLAIANDTLIEPNETIVLSLSSADNSAIFAAQDSTTVTITDNERRIRGNNRANTLRGRGGNEEILGLGGNDRLLGLAGNDRLIGGAGSDRITGGPGADRFVYSGASKREAFSQSLFPNPDRIFDFNVRQGDRIELDFDANPSTINRPVALFNAGDVSGRSLIQAIRAAFADKNQRQPGRQALRANEATFFNFGSQTYLVVNDSQARFSRPRDLVVDVTGMQFRGNDANAGVLNVANYFA